jgi:signal transduction histidine kinase
MRTRMKILGGGGDGGGTDDEQRGSDRGGAVVGGEVLPADAESRRIEAEAARTRAEEQLEQFMSILGHDLRSPVQATLLTAGALLTGKLGELNAQQQRAVGRIAESADRMARMIRDLLDVTRARRGRFRIEPRPLDVHVVSWQVVEEMEAAHPGRTIRHVRKGDGAAELDRERMAQLVSNLLANAIQFGPVDRPVELESGGDRDRVVIRVTNHGPPIAPDLLLTLFDPFCQGAASPDDGLGLGLYIAREIALGHAGSIAVERSDEEATIFRVDLPRRR